MTADTVFAWANGFALCGWLILAGAVLCNSAWARDRLAGFWWPITLCGLYVTLMGSFFGQAEGGFDSLANVKKLFTFDWAVVAGWVHYLAFDLFIGAWIARRVMTDGMSRLWLVLLLPATFLLGPVGLLTFAITRSWRVRTVDLTPPANAGGRGETSQG